MTSVRCSRLLSSVYRTYKNNPNLICHVNDIVLVLIISGIVRYWTVLGYIIIRLVHILELLHELVHKACVSHLA